METMLVFLVGIAVIVIAAAIAWAALHDGHLAAPRDGTVVRNPFDPPRPEDAAGVHDLTPAERERFAGLWRATQASFARDPAIAVVQADILAEEVLRARGFEISELESGSVIERYREAHEVALAARRGTARTEDLRRATLRYRILFDDLLDAA